MFILISLIAYKGSLDEEKIGSEPGEQSDDNDITESLRFSSKSHCLKVVGTWKDAKCDISAFQSSCEADEKKGRVWNSKLKLCECNDDFFLMDFFKGQDGTEKTYQCIHVSEVSECLS